MILLRQTFAGCTWLVSYAPPCAFCTEQVTWSPHAHLMSPDGDHVYPVSVSVLPLDRGEPRWN